MPTKQKAPQGVFPQEFYSQFKTSEDFQSFFKKIYKEGIEAMLNIEMDEHLGYAKHSPKGYNTGNSRNGTFKKTIHSDNLGDVQLDIPRDRNGAFEPVVVPKGQTISSKIEDAILGMYSRGMTVSDICNQIEEIYGLELSETSISNITSCIIENAKQWQNRPLDALYCAVWMDAVVIKIRTENKLVNRAVHIVIGLRADGSKDVLGFWLGANESASFWLTVLNELKARGVQDILIACTDNLKGFTEAIQTVFPQTISQLCVVHQIRNSCKFLVWSDRKEFCKDLRKVYTAINRNAAFDELMKFKEKWSPKYKYAVTGWEQNWDNLTNYFDFPQEIRKIIYTTNTIENLNRGIRKYTKTKTQFPTEDSAIKSLYLAIQNIQKGFLTKIHSWKQIEQQLYIIFEDRINKHG